MRAGDDSGQVHDRDDGSASCRSFTRIVGTVGNNSIDGARNLGVTQHRIGVFLVALCQFQPALSDLEVILFLRKVVRILRRTQSNGCVIQVFRRDSAFLVQRRTAVVKLLRRIQRLLCEPQILRALLHGHIVSHLGLGVAALALHRGPGQILVLKFPQQLVGLHVAAFVHIPFLDR